MLLSRCGSSQIAHGSRLSRLPHSEQVLTVRAACSMALASGSSRVRGCRSKVSAARLALRGPKPGRRASSSISRSISGPPTTGN